MRTPLPLALAGPLLLAACATQAEKSDYYWSSPVDAIRASNPSDIAILRPIDGTEGAAGQAARTGTVPLERFQQVAYKECLKRRYAPLALDFVDRAWRAAEASSGGKGMCGEDAYLWIRVNRFDTSRLEPQGEVRIAADFFLNDGKTGTMLWSAKADRRIVLRREAEVLRDESLLRRAAVERFVEYALQGLPPRVPSAEER
ncbi:MAG TPA: hypothetical protein VFI25_16570 [Planctomycetota bacterium]|jgi:hypothetical protein|nr:hypothetical protein [Planctomycetota bacterium]